MATETVSEEFGSHTAETTIVDRRKAPDGFVHSRRLDSVCTPCVVTLFSAPYIEAIPKIDLSTFVLYLMIYLKSDELWLMSYLISYVILRPYDLTALIHILLLGLRLTISRVVTMHFVLCRFLRIFLRTCYFCHLYEFLFYLRNLHT